MGSWRLAGAVGLFLSVAAPPAAAPAEIEASVAPRRTPDEESEYLLHQAEEALARRIYPTARECLERVMRQQPDSAHARRAKDLLRRVPNERGRLLLGFDSAAEVGDAPHAEWVSDAKIAPVGEGCVHLTLKRSRTRFDIPPEKLNRMKSISFWVWSEAPIVGMTGTTYICLHTDQGNDYLQQKFQLKGDGQWRLIVLDAGGFKRRTKEEDRTFTAIGFWNPSPEIRDFLVDDIRVIEEDPPKTGVMLNAPTGQKPLPPLTPPR